MENYYDNGRVIFGGEHNSCLLAPDKLKDRLDQDGYGSSPTMSDSVEYSFGLGEVYNEGRLQSKALDIIRRKGIKPLALDLERWVEIHQYT